MVTWDFVTTRSGWYWFLNLGGIFLRFRCPLVFLVTVRFLCVRNRCDWSCGTVVGFSVCVVGCRLVCRRRGWRVNIVGRWFCRGVVMTEKNVGLESASPRSMDD
jgi:hypothetical protein